MLSSQVIHSDHTAAYEAAFMQMKAAQMKNLRFFAVNTTSRHTHVTIAIRKSLRDFYSSVSMLAIRRDEDNVSVSVSVGVNANVNVSISINVSITFNLNISLKKMSNNNNIVIVFSIHTSLGLGLSLGLSIRIHRCALVSYIRIWVLV